MQQLSLLFDDELKATPPISGQIDNKGIKRLYYSISEVSRITGLKPYVLRYWETEFKILRPAKNRAGNRIYRKNDIRLLFLIKKLLYDKKFTIEGARQALQELRTTENMQETPSHDDRIDEILKEIIKELKELLELLNEAQEDAPKAE